MPRLLIDRREVEVAAGSTILDAARRLGLDIPTLCFLEGQPPTTSCMVCLVKIKNPDRLVPACATPVEGGMEIESETQEVRQLRRTGLELLLSDHVGDCTAPCQNACPVHLDIPLLLREVAAGDLQAATAILRRDIALAGVVARLCSATCERACRRRSLGGAAAICLVERYVAEAYLESPAPYLLPGKPRTGKRVAIIGAGPAGLSAAYHLLLAGHACTVLDERDRPGGTLRYDIDESVLPRPVLEAEIALIERLGAEFRMNTRVGCKPSLADLPKDYDAVLIAIGRSPQDQTGLQRLLAMPDGLAADTRTHQTGVPGVFTAGDVVRPGPVVRAVADGQAAALCIDHYLSGSPVISPAPAFTAHAGRLSGEEIAGLCAQAGAMERVIPAAGLAAGLTGDEARAEALRCLYCDCAGKDRCRLRHYAAMYGAHARRYRGERRALVRHHSHPEVIYEPGKCILCGQCVQIAADAREPLGLTFIGRGFDVRVGVPFDRCLAEGLRAAARRCAEACPTGALVLRTQVCGETPAGRSPCAFEGEAHPCRDV